MIESILRFQVDRGEVIGSAAGWVYVWTEAGPSRASVIYVGATRLHPDARAEKHLRDASPSIGRIRALYPEMGGDLDEAMAVHAVAVPTESRRALVKAHVAWLLKEGGYFSPRYCGDPPTPPIDALSSMEAACVSEIVHAVAGSSTS